MEEMIFLPKRVVLLQEEVISFSNKESSFAKEVTPLTNKVTLFFVFSAAQVHF